MESRMEKIAKLLNLAKGSTNIHEAESAMKMAQRFALKEDIVEDSRLGMDPLSSVETYVTCPQCSKNINISRERPLR